MNKFIVFKSVDEMPELPVSQASMSWNKTGSWRSATPGHQGKTPPCNFNCPAGEDIRGYINLMKHDQIAEAFDLLTKANPFPATCGRVCYHPCQANCNRHSFDIEIQVRLLEKFIGDWGIENNRMWSLPDLNSKKVAVIGAGPAGLAAAHYLRRKGVSIELYDENHYPGGILHYGIPSYRLDKDVLKAELNRVLNGIEYKANMRFGSDFDFGTLEDFDAVFLATGAHLSKRMNINGEDLSGVESGLDFLKRVNAGNAVKLDGKKVIVIGGGNTACDVSRTAYRLGATVRLAYRRTEKEMPAFAEEIEQLKAEPIGLEFLTAPKRVNRGEDGRLSVICHRMKLGQPDADGRARPVVIEGSDFEMTADVVYAAIGEDPDLSIVPGLEHGTDGDVDLSKVDKRFRQKLFFGGDILPNPRTVPHAAGSGRLAAEKIMAFLRGVAFESPGSICEVVGPEEINYSYFTRINAAKHAGRLTDAGGITDRAAAVEEANRCFSCGVCFECDNCYNFCPDLAVIRTPGGYQVNLDYCKGCGICATECPSGSLGMTRGRLE